MKISFSTLPALLSLLVASFTFSANANEMSAAEPSADMTPVSMASAVDVASAASFASASVSPVVVTAADLITKVYGLIEHPVSIESTKDQVDNKLKYSSDADETGLWLDSDSGYALSYSGMTPEVAAMAQFDESNVSNFGYFFFFPYAVGDRDRANREQCAFCGALLQEMYDMGMAAGVTEDNDDSLFEVLGSYEGNMVNVMLKEQQVADKGAGRFLLILSVTPNSFTAADDLVASN